MMKSSSSRQLFGKAALLPLIDKRRPQRFWKPLRSFFVRQGSSFAKNGGRNLPAFRGIPVISPALLKVPGKFTPKIRKKSAALMCDACSVTTRRQTEVRGLDEMGDAQPTPETRSRRHGCSGDCRRGTRREGRPDGYPKTRRARCGNPRSRLLPPSQRHRTY